VQTPAEVLTDPQARANGYILPVPARDGAGSYDLVASPVQFDEISPELTRAPDSGEHTDQILADELGLDPEAIRGLRASAIVS
jgi:crotonobetainyl-CoA:carnitine CoA-transferase CaiB-like acyl-CoA transferase